MMSTAEDGLPFPQRSWAILTLVTGLVVSVLDSAIANIDRQAPQLPNISVASDRAEAALSCLARGGLSKRLLAAAADVLHSRRATKEDLGDEEIFAR